MIRSVILRACFACFAVLLFSVSFVGCGSGKTEPTGTVSGTVTYKAGPVSEAIVTFKHADTGASAESVLDSSGSYKIVGTEGGIPVGSYTVTITVPQVEDPNSPPDQSPMMMDMEMPNVPERYRSGGTTPLTASIAEGDNAHDFDLTDE